MAENLENEENKEVKKVTRKTTRTTKTKKEETAEVVTEKKKRGRPAKKKEDTEIKKTSRLDDLTELMEKIDKETEKTKTKRKSKVKEEVKEIKEDKKQDKKENKKEKIIKDLEYEKESKIDEEEIEETKDLTVKKNSKELMMNPEKLEKIEEEIKKQTTISDEKKNKITKNIFHNIAIANIVMIYFIFLILGYQTLAKETFMIDLQVFSGIAIGLTIVIFEKAYKKDSGEYAIHGIETMFIAIVTLISTYIFSKYEEKFAAIMLTICYLFDIYFVAKSIIIYLKMKSEALKRTNDIHKIVKK